MTKPLVMLLGGSLLFVAGIGVAGAVQAQPQLPTVVFGGDVGFRLEELRHEVQANPGKGRGSSVEVARGHLVVRVGDW